LQIPEDLTLITVDGVDHAPPGFPELAVAAFPFDQVGYLGMELLHKQITDTHLHHAHIVLRCELIENYTCAAPRTELLKV
jgi:DNA-binding LacI/PurR family transcriptional regulator